MADKRFTSRLTHEREQSFYLGILCLYFYLELSQSFAQLTIADSLILNDNTLTLSGSSSNLYFEGTQTLNSGTIVFDPATSNTVWASGTDGDSLTLAAAVTVRGGRGQLFSSGSGTQSLVNQGLIQADVSGESLTINTESFTNEGTLRATDGGQLEVENLISTSGDVFVETSSSLNVTGNYTQTADGSLNIELGGTNSGEFGRLLISDTANLDGTLSVSLNIISSALLCCPMISVIMLMCLCAI